MKGYAFAKRLLESRVFEEDLFPAHMKRGRGRMFVVTGGNAAGKSLLRRVAHALCQNQKKRFMGLSMEDRSSSGMMYSIAKSMVYGDETYNATGLLSARLVTSGIHNCREWDDRHVVFWDEPDLGLSDEMAATVGGILSEFAPDMPDKTDAAFVATHSRHLIHHLLPAKPHWIHMGVDAPKSLKAWADREVIPADFEAIQKDASRRMKAVFALTKKKKG